MNPTNPFRFVLAFTCFALAACGGSNSSGQTTATVGAAGATLKTSTATLSIPANALSTATQVTLRETEPQHAGRAQRIEVEPHGLALAQPARLSMQVDDTNAKVKVHGDDDSLTNVEVEDRNHHEYKTTMSQLGAVEIELEHGAACSTACTTGQECDDGVCKAHVEDANARTCDPVCLSGEECDDGTCKAHVEVEPGAVPGTAACTPSCATGLECDNGVCKPHGA